MGCVSTVALNKRELIRTNSTKKSKQSDSQKQDFQFQCINLLNEREYIFLNRLFFSWVTKKGKKATQSPLTSLQKEVFIIMTQFLFYGVRNGYKDLNIQTFLNEWNYQFDKLNTISRDSIENHAVFIAIELLVNIELSSLDKSQHFSNFLFSLKDFLLTNAENPSNIFENKNTNSDSKAKTVKVFYTYRLTYKQPGSDIKQYYMGYRGCITHPSLDKYYSSSDLVKDLIKKNGLKCFEKKILGIYLTQEEALFTEVKYHATLQVDINDKFLNQARQTTTAFLFDNTGKVQTAESNEKRSAALKGRNRFTPEGLARLVTYQTDRERTPEHREVLREKALARNAQQVVCPYCGKKGQAPAMSRWHFENCKLAPNQSEKTIPQREELRQRMRGFNTKQKNE